VSLAPLGDGMLLGHGNAPAQGVVAEAGLARASVVVGLDRDQAVFGIKNKVLGLLRAVAFGGDYKLQT
jgi:hypothetical protein